MTGVLRGGANPSESVTEAIHRLARRGYGRSFEERQGRLWCPSCEVTFEGHDLVIDEVVPVTSSSGTGAILCALRCASCRASGTWLVRRDDEAGLRLLAELRASTSDPRADRGSADAPT